ncbi:hypothetical protein Moror_12910 [Moniliophthora roreri MCA 2997]|uniref:Deoxyribonuclease NucA/NucB domain-containing protein n=2 Tax=Moniliophthora roreri TaxID=221103 RepID=V2XMC4_MONRO|nr:hypothetical protein Moror_12910 [Moniliophthora roreri MCA 2997]
MMNTSRLQIFALAAYLIAAVSGATITFDCRRIPETCNNMCYASSHYTYRPMHFDPNTDNRRGRRQAAGCLPNPNRCSTNPPNTQRVTCDEYPFASAHGIGNNGWYSNSGATTRCVSSAECSSQGGSLSSFYQSFNRVDGTRIDIVVSEFSSTVAPYCNNPGLASDGNFRRGGRPPNRRDLPDGFNTGGKPPVRRAEAEVHQYKTANNLTVRSLTGPLEIGSEIFVPNNEWQNHPKVKAMLARRQNDDGGCTGTTAQMDAASLLEKHELGTTDKIVERL